MSSTDKGIEPATATAAAVATPATATGGGVGELRTARPVRLRGNHLHAQHGQRQPGPVGVTAVVFGVALMFGGLTQLIAGVIQLRTGNTFGGMLFCGFGAFWLSLFAIAQFFLKAVPLTQVGHALGLLLYGFGIFSAIMLAASFRTSIAVVVALLLLTVTLFVLAASNYGASSGRIKTGGWIGLAVAAFAFYLSLAEVCEASYGREILPVGHLAKK